MTTIAHSTLGKYVGIDASDIFQHVTPQVSFALPTGHVLNPQGSGSCRWGGKVTDHSLDAKFYANERSMAFNGFDGTNARLPLSGECILLEILPSCTSILDVSVQKSTGGETGLWDGPAPDDNFVTDFAAGAPVTSQLGIQPCAVPVGGAAGAFPNVEIWMGKLNGCLTDVADISTFQRMMVVNTAGDINPELALLDDTGSIEDQYVLYAKVLADVPADSFLRVTARIEKPTR